MKTAVYLLLAGAGLLGACQRTTEPETPKAVAAPVAAETEMATTVPTAPLPPTTTEEKKQPFVRVTFAAREQNLDATYEQQTAAQTGAVLDAHDLSESLTQSGVDDNPLQNGFFGSEGRRIEFVFSEAAQDPEQTQVYHVRGKDRFKQRITPFGGTIRFEQLWLQRPTAETEGEPRSYIAVGTYELQEDEAARGAGTFSGRVMMEFVLDPATGKASLAYSYDSPVSAAGYLFDGKWQSRQNAADVKPVTWAKNFGTFANEVFEEFMIGDRDSHISPKYAKLGWQHFWENDEWWAETPKTASL